MALLKGRCTKSFEVVLTQALEALATLKGRGVKNVGCAKSPNVSIMYICMYVCIFQFL